MRWVDFTPPGSIDRESKFVSVRVSPATASSEEEALDSMALWLIRRYDEALLGWPQLVWVDGRKGAEVKYEELVFLEAPVQFTGWTTMFQAEDREWLIEVAGRSEHRQEMEGIHGQFVSLFHVVSP